MKLYVDGGYVGRMTVGRRTQDVGHKFNGRKFVDESPMKVGRTSNESRTKVERTSHERRTEIGRTSNESRLTSNV
jgi:hypothetical protein